MKLLTMNPVPSPPQQARPDDNPCHFPSQLAMKLRHLALAAFSLAAALPLIAADHAPDESNLVLLDTKNPAIRDLAVIAGDVDTYDSLNDKNKIGVFLSEGLVRETFGSKESGFNLLYHPWKLPTGKTKPWTINDFIDNSDPTFPLTHPVMFATNGYVEALDLGTNRRYLSSYQVLPTKLVDPTTKLVDPTKEFPWRIQGNSLRWNENAAEPTVQFNDRLNAPSAKVQLCKRFEFPTGLNYAEDGDTDSEKDRKTISNTATKLIVVVHGWNSDPETDPYAAAAKTNWWPFLQTISEQIESGKPTVTGWDLYAYRWGNDSYTGNMAGNSGPIEAKLLKFDAVNAHDRGGVGLAVENGIQAAEIGYQHGLVLGKLIRDHCTANGTALAKIHFIAHSAGAWVARSASLYLNQTMGSSLEQEVTLLDPFNPKEANHSWVNESSGDYPDNIDTSALQKNLVDQWILQTNQVVRSENIISDDLLIFGTNELYPSFTQNRTVGHSTYGLGYIKYKESRFVDWDGHSGPINFFAYSVGLDRYAKLTGTNKDKLDALSWGFNTVAQMAAVGWEQSFFRQEYKANTGPGLASSSFMCSPNAPQQSPRYGPQPAPAPPLSSPWQQILVDVDSIGWVRAMLLPANGGAAELAGPVRPEPDGTFSIDLSDHTVLTGSFDTSVTPVAITLTIDGVPFGQKVEKTQGTLAQAGIDAQTNAAGNVVFSMVLADGTAGMTVARDTDNTGWQGSGVGTVDATGAFTVTGADGLQVTGQLQAGGGLDPQATIVAPPQVPEIYVVDTAGFSLTTGTASKSCGSVQLGGSSSALAITIKNTGTVDLTDLAVSIDGANAADFAVGALGMTSLAPDASVTLNVTFTPGAASSRTAALHIASNDADENPFHIALTGRGFTATPLAAGGSGTSGVLAAGGEDFYRVTVPGPGILITWSEGSTDTYGTLLHSGGMVLGEDNDSDLQANFRTSAVVAAGDYFISVKGGNDATAGGYTLRSRFISDQEPIQISFLERTEDGANLGFTNTAGVSYGIQVCDDLKNWKTMTSVTGQGAEMLVPLSGLGGSPTAFFRVSHPLATASYSSWSAGHFLTESDSEIAGPVADPDHDSIPNAVEMVLGGNPKASIDTSMLPAMERVTTDLGTGAGEYFLFTYRRTDLSVAAGMISGVEHDADLAGPWTQAVNGVNGVIVVETHDFFGTGVDRVQVYIPETGNQKIFARLNVTVP